MAAGPPAPTGPGLGTWAIANRRLPTPQVVADLTMTYARSSSRPRLLTDGEFAVWDVGDRLVGKFAVDESTSAKLDVEVRVVGALADAPVAVPEVVVVGTWADGLTFALLTRIDGQPADQLDPPATTDRSMVAQAAGLLDFLAALPPAPLDVPLSDPPDPAELVGRLEDRADTLNTALGPAVLHGLIADATSVPADLPPTLCHSDIKGEHVFIDLARARISGVIDWADSCVGDSAGDLGAFSLFWGPETVHAIAAQSGHLTEADAERGLFLNRAGLLIGYADALTGANHWPLALVRRMVMTSFGLKP